ncbi:MAG: hypothetical protein AAFP85_13125 [Pseudomonadota bacterium]
MRALILRNDPNAAVASSRALIDKGFQILCVDTRAVAETLVRMDTIDLLVMDEQVQGELTHTVALSGERKNPYISAILMTDRPREETDDLYELIPSLYALAGVETEPALIGQLAVASVAHTPDTIARVAQNAAADLAEAQAPEMFATPDVEPPLAEPEAWDHIDIPVLEEEGLPAIPQEAVRIPSLAARMRVGATMAAYETDNKAASPFARNKTSLPQFAEPRHNRPQPAA